MSTQAVCSRSRVSTNPCRQQAIAGLLNCRAPEMCSQILLIELVACRPLQP